MSRLLQALRTKVAIATKDAGMSTAEYAIGIVAACAFAAFLYKLLTGSFIDDIIKGLISHALHLIPGF
ncbi:MAG TPA: DUF4244 domain-containing protein [Mycobacteriales bacterium]|nr:DUF4244 domain-containing protein [Mycobacteriales bacterium]